MKKFSAVLLSLITLLSLSASVYAADLGAENTDSAFDVVITCPNSATAGKSVTVSVSVDGISAPDGLQYVEFNLYYDTSKLTLNEALDGNGINVFDGYCEWEDVSVLVTDGSSSYLKLIAATAGGDGGSALTNAVSDGDITFSISFIVNSDVTSDIGLRIPHNEIFAFCCDGSTPFTRTEYVGNGSSAFIHVCVPDGKGWYSSENEHYHMCACGETLDTASHTAGEWVIVEEAQIGVEGKKVLNCTVCRRMLSEQVIEALPLPVVPQTPIGLRGDVNVNGEIDARDYVLMKRAYFGTANLGSTASLLSDVNNNSDFDARDYVMLKRAYFGTYEIPKDIKYVY